VVHEISQGYFLNLLVVWLASLGRIDALARFLGRSAHRLYEAVQADLPEALRDPDVSVVAAEAARDLAAPAAVAQEEHAEAKGEDDLGTLIAKPSSALPPAALPRGEDRTRETLSGPPRGGKAPLAAEYSSSSEEEEGSTSRKRRRKIEPKPPVDEDDAPLLDFFIDTTRGVPGSEPPVPPPLPPSVTSSGGKRPLAALGDGGDPGAAGPAAKIVKIGQSKEPPQALDFFTSKSPPGRAPPRPSLGSGKAGSGSSGQGGRKETAPRPSGGDKVMKPKASKPVGASPKVDGTKSPAPGSGPAAVASSKDRQPIPRPPTSGASSQPKKSSKPSVKGSRPPGLGGGGSLLDDIDKIFKSVGKKPGKG
jgi:hypothetical protein